MTQSAFQSTVMTGLVPAIQVLLAELRKKDVGARDKRGHDALYLFRN
jgi:hypothetical protein